MGKTLAYFHVFQELNPESDTGINDHFHHYNEHVDVMVLKKCRYVLN